MNHRKKKSLQWALKNVRKPITTEAQVTTHKDNVDESLIVIWLVMNVEKKGLWIRIHFLRIRIRIQWIRMEANTDPDTDPDPDPIRIQGFNDQKLKKNNS